MFYSPRKLLEEIAKTKEQIPEMETERVMQGKAVNNIL